MLVHERSCSIERKHVAEESMLRAGVCHGCAYITKKKASIVPTGNTACCHLFNHSADETGLLQAPSHADTRATWSSLRDATDDPPHGKTAP